ncbi:hypothetical protein GY21_20085 [Cryobacterium roopkundense]|uniref:Uncharacterized protein n=1 Tax=Cryobacterium roopkundense TaxID=1001240 RepID=A0A099J2S2_9MICO|nr:hypothetical protein GY21_20085 [Cryobacterium roopkundense]
MSGPRIIALEQIGEFVDGAHTSFLLSGEAFRKLASVTLTLGFKRDDVADTNTAITSNMMGHNLTSIQEFV